ncbi:MAG: hypothetical protein ABIH20_02270 [Candidatus Diapherotrites archaeon]
MIYIKPLICAVVLLIIFFSGCPKTIPEPTELPDDFEITYSSGAMHLEWGGFEFKAAASGKAYLINTMGMEMEVRKDFTVTYEELLEIYKAAVVNDFFSLNDSYEDPFVMDGGWSKISIYANGSRKNVSISNYQNDQFDAVSSKVAGLVTSKLGTDAFFPNFFDYCDEQRIECIERPMIYKCPDAKCDISDPVCDEWAEYCSWDYGEIPTPTGELTPVYCDKLQNREECIDYCTWNDCSQELCDTLVFEAPECTECSPGCCEHCTDLSYCTSIIGCDVAWILPMDGAWEFGGCSNIDLCMGSEEACAGLSSNYQGYEVAAATEENSDIAGIYQSISALLESAYLDNCE